MSLLNTLNENTLYDSLSEIFSVPRIVIEGTIKDNFLHFIYCDSAEDIDLKLLIKSIEKGAAKPIKIREIVNVTINHLTTRSESSLNNLEPLFSLHDALTIETELSMKFRALGITFKKSGHGIETFVNGKMIDWNSMIPRSSEGPCILMILRRLKPSSTLPESDKCINGFLFGGDIWRINNVKHIRNMPEIAENILRVLGKRKEINEWVSSVKPYIFTFSVPVNKITFDDSQQINGQQTQLRLLQHSFFYLGKLFLDDWEQVSNPIILLDDNYNVEPKQILAVTPVTY